MPESAEPREALVETRRQEVMEQARAGREGLFQRFIVARFAKIIDTPALTKLLNSVPFVGDVKMIRGAVLGREGSKQLTGGERLNYLLASATGVIVLGLLIKGDYANAAIGEVISSVLTKLDQIPAILKEFARLSSVKNPRLGYFINVLADFVTDKRDILAGVFAVVFKNALAKLSPAKLD
ncbi:MAG: hypothetical protein Q7K39_04625 [Candidatus Magasanikbacteria bacterium]|nr:hypothetical protein [Candidatus Magasanikbacteria bacterium]